MRNSNNNQNLVKARRIGAAVLAVTLAATVALTVVRPAIASKSQNTATSSIDDAAFAAEVSAAKEKLTIPFDQSVMDEAFPDVDWTVSHNSLADTLVERNEQAGFDTALSFPYTGVSQDDGQYYSSEQIRAMRSEDEKERLNNLPLLYSDLESYKYAMLSDGTTIQDLNSSWIEAGLKMFEDAYLHGNGIADLIEETDPGHYVVAEKVRPYARANALLRRAYGEAEVRRVYSEKHWGLNHVGLAAEVAQNHPEVSENPDRLVLYTKATTFEGPENRDALVLRFVSKNGTTIAEIADNVHDKRPMIPGKQPKPEKETTPQETTPQETPQETTPQETTAPETKTPGVDRETTPRNTPKKKKPDPKRTTEETTPQETTPQETKPSETPSREDREDNNKKRNVAPLNHDGEKAGGSSTRTGTNTVEYSDHKNETGKGHGDPAKETMVAPTTEASYQDVEVKQNHENRMNQETKTAEPAANRLTDDKSGKQLQINGDANQAAKDGASVISNFVGEAEDHD